MRAISLSSQRGHLDCLRNDDAAKPTWRFVRLTPRWLLLGFALSATTGWSAKPGGEPLGIGEPAAAAAIAAWDIDVAPDGSGLPVGGATAREGAAVYRAYCAACHGATGREGPRDRLVGREPGDAFPFGERLDTPRTVGNYWPYATTLFDYTRRAMPENAPGSLSDAEVYAVTAYILYLNDLIGFDDEMNAQSLPAVVMPARKRFVPDDRAGGAEVR